MFKRFFNHQEEEEEEVYETIDPILEERRKQKFSTPLIYDEDDQIEIEEPKKETKKPEIKPQLKKAVLGESDYEMRNILSPMTGVTQVVPVSSKPAKPKVKKAKKYEDEEDLIPIISPFYGMNAPATEKKDDASEKIKKEEVKEEKIVIKEEPSVTQNLRNIKDIVEEEQEQLKIIEERTGEFKFDFKEDNKNTFIDEIDDSMSLDELMTLYEKKFRD